MSAGSEPPAACSEESALAWLGFDPGIDVVDFDLNTEIGSPHCVVDGRTSKRGDFAGILATEDSAQWRSCVTGDVRVIQTLKLVSCDVAHVGEYIGAPTVGVAKQGECEAAAVAYIGRADTRELTVYALAPITSGPAKPRCMIAVTSGRPLVDTLRRLGNANLPRSS